MAGFDEVLQTIGEEVAKLAIGELSNFKDQLVEDAKAFATKKAADLERWTRLLAAGDLDEEEFKLLLLGAKNLLEIRAETYVGIAKARIDQLRKAVFDIVIKAATSLLI
jgi:hypothetical protein